MNGKEVLFLMRAVVFSDIHNRTSYVIELIERHKDNTDLFIFLGDGNRDVDEALYIYPNIKIERVSGNCDFSSTYPSTKTISFAGKKILMTHGHPYYVKHGYSMIENEAEKNDADICLFGHTHIAYIEKINDVYYMNPGTLSMGSYGIIDIENGKIFAYNNEI